MTYHTVCYGEVEGCRTWVPASDSTNNGWKNPK